MSGSSWGWRLLNCMSSIRKERMSKRWMGMSWAFGVLLSSVKVVE